jgi:hypothetical protein
LQDVRAQVCARITTSAPDDAKLVCNDFSSLVLVAFTWISASLFNVFTDYLSLFVIRPILIQSGTKPVISLALGAVSGAAIVLAANSLREVTFWFDDVFFGPSWDRYVPEIVPTSLSSHSLVFILAALAVFIWLLLFAIGILAARVLTPLSWIVGGTQWFLKEGAERPLKAIGYVAAVVVFVGTVAGRWVFSVL